MAFEKPIELLVMDVDGVLTDGGIIRDDAGQQIKRFHVRDGTGIVLWRRLGKHAGLITGKESEVVTYRAAELGIEHVFQNVSDKIAAFNELLEDLELTPQQAAYIGDDLPDIPVMRRCGCAIAVQDASEEVRAIARYVTRFPGGYGAVRDAVEWLCKEMGAWQKLVGRYTGAADDNPA